MYRTPFLMRGLRMLKEVLIGKAKEFLLLSLILETEH